MEHDVPRPICHCMVVDEREVITAIRRGARTVEEVGAACDAGTGCGSCRGAIESTLHDEELRRARKGTPDEVLAQLGLFGGGAKR
jgi:NAD(P)H-nitrite reductase large subunit